jgi:hypothetical protein
MIRKTALLVVLAVIVAGCSSSSSGGGKKTSASAIEVSGKVTLADMPSARAAALNGANASTPGCKGLGAYSAVAPGGDVVIANDSGKTLTIAHLAGGFVADDDATMCSFTFTASVPAGAGFYSIAVGGQPAKKLSEADMKAGPTLTVGQG